MEAKMSYPMNLVLIRHGESEGNRSNWFSRHGDNRYFTPEHLARHSAWWHLTELGIKQAEVTGEWLRKNNLHHFDHHIVSSHVRAIETASYLGLDDALWDVRYELRERDFGLVDVLADDEKNRRFPEYVRRLDFDRYFNRPPKGESMDDMRLRIEKSMIPLLRDTADGERVLIVSHGDTIRALRIIIEGINPVVYNHLVINDDPYLDTSNCQIVEYTRVNPKNKDDVRETFGWVRSLCPAVANAPASYDWVEIHRNKFSNTHLLSLTSTYPRLVD